MSNATWKTRDGGEIRIHQMSNGHLLNAIKMLLRKADYIRSGVLASMDAYMADCPDGAYDACNSEASQLMDADEDEVLTAYVPAWTVLKVEAKRRRLEISLLVGTVRRKERKGRFVCLP